MVGPLVGWPEVLTLYSTSQLIRYRDVFCLKVQGLLKKHYQVVQDRLTIATIIYKT